MTRKTLSCGCIIRHYDPVEDSLIEMDVEWCEAHERAEECVAEIDRLRASLQEKELQREESEWLKKRNVWLNSEIERLEAELARYRTVSTEVK